MKKRIISLILTLCMALSLTMVNAFAVELDEESSNEDPNYVATIFYKDENGNDTSTSYTTLDEALLNTYYGDKIVLLADCNLSANAELPEGVTLVIPTAANANDTITGNNKSGGVTIGSAYVTLNIPAEVTLTVNGTLLVAGNQQTTQPKSGCLTGDFGKIDLEGTLVVENGGKLYARGEISGSGEVIAKSGSTVYQMFQINDWRGGTATVSAYGADNYVFPFNLYEVKNITATTTYYNGSTLKGQYYVYARSTSVPGEETVIGNGGQFEFEDSNAEDDHIVMSYANGKTTVTLHGALKTGHITVTITIAIFNYTISSADLVCPFGYNMDVEIAGDGSMSISNQMKFLPGCNITVKNGGKLTVENCGEVYFYGENGYTHTPAYTFAGWGPATAATLTVENGGQVNCYGTIGSTDSAFTNVGNFTAGTTTATVNEVTQSGSTVTLVPVTFYTYVAPTVEG